MPTRVPTSSPVTALVTRSRPARVGVQTEMDCNQSGIVSGGRNNPPANASGSSTTCASASAALAGSE